jgi:hypothetical protein
MILPLLSSAYNFDKQHTKVVRIEIPKEEEGQCNPASNLKYTCEGRGAEFIYSILYIRPEQSIKYIEGGVCLSIYR